MAFVANPPLDINKVFLITGQIKRPLLYGELMHQKEITVHASKKEPLFLGLAWGKYKHST